MRELAGFKEVAYFNVPDEPVCLVIFLPGTGASPVFYHPFLESLVEKGYAVIGYDYPGHGTRRGEGLEGFYIPRVLSEVKKIILQAKHLTRLPVVLIGSSMGGIIAYYLGIEFSGMDAVVSHNAVVLRWVKDKLILLHPPLKTVEILLKVLTCFFPNVTLSTSAYVRWKYVFEDRGMLRDFLGHPWCVRRYPLKSIYSLLFHKAPEGLFPEKPVLVITGERDRVVPSRFQEISATSGGSNVEFKVIKGAGHMLPLEYREKFIQEVDAWLRSTLHL